MTLDPLLRSALRDQLSARERETLTYVARGWTNPQIAQELAVELRTVRTFIERIRRKLALTKGRGRAGRADLVAWAQALKEEDVKPCGS